MIGNYFARLKNWKKEDDIEGDIRDMIQDKEPLFTAEFIAKEHPKDFNMSTFKQYGNKGNLVTKVYTPWNKVRDRIPM